MILQLTNLHAHVSQATEKEIAWLRGYLTFEDESKRFRRDRRGKVHASKNAYTNLYEGFSRSFPSGLTAAVLRDAAKDDFEVQVVDKRTWPYASRTLANLFVETGIPTDAIDWLYDYQREAVSACIRRTRGIVHAPTGSGKSEIFSALTMILPVRWLVIVPEKGLLNNAANRIEERSQEEVGRIGDGLFDDTKRVTVATYQSLDQAFRSVSPRVTEKVINKRKRIRALLDSVQGIVYDEVHMAPGDSSYRILMHCPAFYRIGFSGTPLQRGDRRSILSVAAMGEVIFHVKTEVLIEGGYVSKPSIVMVPCAQEGDAMTWQGAYGELVVRSRKRNKIAVELARRIPKPALVFVKEIKHGRALTEAIGKAGLNAAFVWGNEPIVRREAVMKQLSDGELDVCVCNVVFQTGIDIPELRGIVNIAGGKSTIATIQRVGRGSRVIRDGKYGRIIKDKFMVYDILDRDAGHKTAAKYIEKHAKRRMRDYSREGWSVSIDETLGAQIVMSR